MTNPMWIDEMFGAEGSVDDEVAVVSHNRSRLPALCHSKTSFLRAQSVHVLQEFSVREGSDFDRNACFVLKCPVSSRRGIQSKHECTYGRPQDFRVLTVVGNDYPCLSGLRKHLLTQMASSSTFDTVQISVYSVHI